MLTRQALRFGGLRRTCLKRASWDTVELTIPADEKPILSLKYDRKFISVLGYHNAIALDNVIDSALSRDRGQPSGAAGGV